VNPDHDRRREPGNETPDRGLWLGWGRSWSRYTTCHGCGIVRYCGAARRAGPYLCLGCFDPDPAAMRMLKRSRS
jgi:hypothetical protein